MSKTVPYTRHQKALRMTKIAVLLAAALSSYRANAQAYSVDDIGDWNADAGNANTLAGALQQPDVVDNGVILNNDLVSGTWSNWGQIGGAVRLLPGHLTLGASDTFKFDLGSYRLAGVNFTFVTGAGTLAIANGTLGSTNNDLYFGYDGAANVIVGESGTATTVDAKDIFVGKEGAAYNGHVTFDNATVNADNLTVHANITGDTPSGSALTAKDSRINLDAGTFHVSGEGNHVEGDPPTVSLDNATVTGVDELEIVEGGSVILSNGAGIAAKNIIVDGTGEKSEDPAVDTVRSLLGGSGSLTWTGDMTASEGGHIDLSEISVNGGAVGSLTVGSSGTAQHLYINGGKVSDNGDGSQGFAGSRLTLEGDLSAINGSFIHLNDAPRVSGLDNVNLSGGSKMLLRGQLEYDGLNRKYLPSRLNADGVVSVTDGSILAIQDGWQVRFEGDDLSVIDDSKLYVGLDLDKEPSDEWGQGIRDGVQTRLQLDGSLSAGATNGSNSEIVIQDGAAMAVTKHATLGEAAGSNVELTVDQAVGGGAPISDGSSFSVGGDFVVGAAGSATVTVGEAGVGNRSSISTGSTLLGAEAGSTAKVVINAGNFTESLLNFYGPAATAWRVTGQGGAETDLDNLRAAGNSSLMANSGLIFIGSGGVFSMGGQDASYANDYGMARFGAAELRLRNGTFSNQGVGAAQNVGGIEFLAGSSLSGKGHVYAGDYIHFLGANLLPGSRFIYDDIDDDNDGPLTIGKLQLHVNNSNGKVVIDGASRIQTSLSAPSAEGGVASSVEVHNVDVDLSQGFLIDFYRIFIGSYKLLDAVDGAITGTYTGYTLRDNPEYFALNGNRLKVDLGGGNTVQSDRILIGTGDIRSYFNNDHSELWVDIQDIAINGNVVTTWTGAESNIWSMFGKNWDLPTTFQTAQFLDGDSVNFIDTPGNQDITLKTYAVAGEDTKEIIISEMNVIGDGDWSFSSDNPSVVGIHAYNSELYTTLKLDDPNERARPTGRLNKLGSGTLTLNTDNEFYGGIHLGGLGMTGGTVRINREKSFGVYDLSNIDRGADKGTVFVVEDANIITGADVKAIQNRFVVQNDKILDLNILNQDLTIRGDFAYMLGGNRGAGGGAFYVAGTVNADKDIILSGNATGIGGSLYIDRDGVFNAPSLSISNSFANDLGLGGGGIFFAGAGPANLHDVTLENNDAIGSGGGLYMGGNGGTLTLTGKTTFKNNRSSIDGGGAHISGGNTLALDTSADDATFTGNLTTVVYDDPEGGENSLNPLIQPGESTSNAMHLASGATLDITGSHHVYFYDPISGAAGAVVNIGTQANDSVYTVFRGNSVFAGETTVGQNTVFRLEFGDTQVAGKSVSDGLAGYGVQALYTDGGLVEDFAQWTAVGQAFHLGENATITGTGVIGGTQIDLNGRLILDDGQQYDATDPNAVDPDTIGYLGVIGNVSIDDTASWEVTLGSDGLPTGFRSSDQVRVVGSAQFTGAIDDRKFDVNLNELVRGKFKLMTTTGGLSNFNTDKKLSGTPVYWNYGSGIIDLAHGGLTGNESNAAWFARARAVTYVEGNDLILDLAARNRHVEATGAVGTWRDNNLWEFDSSTGLPEVGSGNLTNDWNSIDTGPITDLFINGDMVTFAPSSDQSFTIEGVVRPVDMFVGGTGNVSFDGTGSISTFARDDNAAIGTSIRPSGTAAGFVESDNDYGIPLYTGKLYKTSANTLTFTNGANTFIEGIQIGGQYTRNQPVVNDGTAGGTLQFSNGNQLQVGSGRFMDFLGSGLLRNTATTTLATNIRIADMKTATFDDDAGLVLTYSGQITDLDSASAGAVRKSGAGELWLTQSNPFSGGLTWGASIGAPAGTIRVGASQALGAAYTGTAKVGVVDVIGSEATLTQANGDYTLHNRFDVVAGADLAITTVGTSPGGRKLTLSNVDAGALNGGAISVAAGAAAQLTANGSGTLIFNTNSAANGGAIYTAHTGDLNLGATGDRTYLTFQNNHATAGGGGAIYANSNVSIADGDTRFVDNTAATHGGAVFATGNVALTGWYFQLNSNQALNGNGGAIYTTAGKVTLQHDYAASSFDISGNQALAGSGGAIYARAIELTNNGGDATISGNSAENGGAFFINGGTLTLSANAGDITFSGNTANLGEAVYVAGTNGAIAVDTAADHWVMFSDTLASDALAHVFTKTGDGALIFNNAKDSSNFLGKFAINAGNMRVTQGTVIGGNQTDTRFNLADGAYLTGGGTIGAKNVLIQGTLSADTDTGVRLEAASSHGFYDIGTFYFDSDLVKFDGAKILVDMTNTGGINDQGQADEVHISGALDQSSTGEFDFYNFSLGHYLLIDTQAVVAASPVLQANMITTVHGEALTDRHGVQIVRGDDVDVAVHGGTDHQVWAKAQMYNLYMYWSGADTADWNPYDTNAVSDPSASIVGNENWVNYNLSSGKPAEGHIVNNDAVYFADNAYDYAAGTLTGPAITRSDIAIHANGVAVTDMVVDNTLVNYTFTGGGITSSENFDGDILSGAPFNYVAGAAPQNLTKQGTGTLTFANTTNSFAGTLLMEGGIINLNNTANTFGNGITYQGNAGTARTLNFTTSTQLGDSAIRFNADGTLHGLGRADLANQVTLASGVTAVLQADDLLAFAGTGDISGSGNLQKTGTGILQVASNANNEVSGVTDLLAGTFRIAQGSNYGVLTTGSAFNQSTGTQLAGGGTLYAEAMTFNGSLAPDAAVLTASAPNVPANSQGTLALNASSVVFDDFVYRYDLGIGSDNRLGTTPTGDLINILQGTVTLSGANTLNLGVGTIEAGKSYLLINSATVITSDGINALTDPTTTFATITQGGSFIEPRIGTQIMFGDAGGSGMDKTQLWLSSYRNSLHMNWNLAGDGLWDETAANWSSVQQNNGVRSTVFNEGDYVHFVDAPGGAAAERTLTLDDNLVVSGMEGNAARDFVIAGTGSIHAKVTDTNITGQYIGQGVAPDRIDPDGALVKNGTGKLTINNGENVFDGGLLVNSGTLAFLNARNTFQTGIELAGGLTSITLADQLTVGGGQGIDFTGNATLRSNADVALGHTVTVTDGVTADFDASDANTLTLNGAIGQTGSATGGRVSKTGTGTVVLTAASSFSGGTSVEQGVLEITGNAWTSGSAASQVQIAGAGTFKVGRFAAPFTLNNVFRDKTAGTDTGTLQIDNGNAFAFGSGTGNAALQGDNFSGRVEMYNARYAVDAITEAFFTTGGAALVTKDGSLGTVTDRSSGNPNEMDRYWDLRHSDLVFAGGTMAWSYDNTNAALGYIAAEDIQVDASVDTTFQIILTDPINATAPSGVSLFAMQRSDSGLLLATSETDISDLSVGTLQLELFVGANPVAGTESMQAIEQNSVAVADGYFDWGVFVDNTDELRAGYILKRLEVYEDKVLSVVREGADGASFGVEITDKTTNGNVAFEDRSNAHTGIILNHENSYTGTSTIRSDTTLIMGVDHALGTETAHTRELIVTASNSKVDLAATEQIVGALTIDNRSGTGGVLDFNNGSTLTVADNGGTVLGDNALISSGTANGTLNVAGGVLQIGGHNNGVKLDAAIGGGATIQLNQVDGLGLGETVAIANSGALNFSGAAGTFDKQISGDGTVLVNNAANVALNADNSGFDGAQSKFDIADGATLTAGQAQHIGQADIHIGGRFIADNDAAWTLDASNVLTGTGNLVKQNAGELTVGHANGEFTGHTDVNDGQLKLTADGAIGSGVSSTNTATVASGAQLELATGVTQYGVDTGGEGTVLVSGNDIQISGDNSGFLAAGDWHITGSAKVSQQQNLGQAAVFIDGVAAHVSLETTAAGDFNFVNALTGNGTLSAKLTGSSDVFTFGAHVGSAFAGTVQLQDSRFEIGNAGQAAVNTAALALANLQVSSGNVTQVSGDATIGALTFDGGRVLFDAKLPPDNRAKGIVTANDGITITGNAGQVAITSDLSNALTAQFDNPTQAGERPILDQDNAGSSGIKLADGTVYGSANTLTLVDVNGNLITNGREVNINENGSVAAIGTYDYSLAAGVGDEDLYVDYVLTQLDLQQTADDMGLTLDNTGAVDDTLSAKITGAGNLDIAANSGQIVLNNGTNDYTGQTKVRSGTLVSGADGALGIDSSHTRRLALNTGAAFDLNGYTQNIGQLANAGRVTLGSGTLIANDAIASNGLIDLGTGTFKVNAGGVVGGTNGLIGLAGSLLEVNASHLQISGANAGMHGASLIEGGGTIELDHVDGLGDGVVAIQASGDTLYLNIPATGNAGRAQPFANTIEGNGELRVNAPVAGNEVYITHANDDFHGLANVEHGHLVVRHIGGVGDAMITASHSDATYTWQNIQSGSAASVTIDNYMTGVGTIAFDDSRVRIARENTAGTFALINNAYVTLDHVSGVGTSESNVQLDSSATLVLAVDNAALGHVDNQGFITFERSSPNLWGMRTLMTYDTMQPMTVFSLKHATMNSLTGAGTLGFNVDFGLSEADFLTITGAATGHHSVWVNAIGWPNDGSEIIPLIGTGVIASAGTFALPTNFAGQQEIEIGSFAYALHQGAPSGKIVDPHIWYLGEAGLSKQAEAVVGSVAGMGLGGLLELDTLVKRMGELRLSVPQRNKEVEGWVRGYGWRQEYDARVSGSPFDENYYGLDIGFDRSWRKSSGYLYAGGFLGTGRIDRRFNGWGNGKMDTARMGLYATYLHDDGWYLDAVGKYNRYDSSFNALSATGDRAHGSYDQNGYGVSIEGGRRFANEDDWFIEPQLQVAVSHIQGANYTTRGRFPVDVRLEAQDSTQVRGGVLGGRVLQTDNGPVQLYGKAAWVNVSGSRSRISTSDGLEYDTAVNGGRYELGFGVNWETSQYGQLYFDYEYVKHDRFEIPWKVNLGYRMTW